MNFSYFYNKLLEIFSQCLICKLNTKIVCEACKSQFNPSCFSDLEGYPCFIPYKYDFPLDQLILQFKYNNKYFLADFFAQLIREKFSIPDGVLIPIPTSRTKLFKRGYNQTVLLARSLGGIVEPMVLKTSNPSHNVNSSYEERKERAQFIEIDDLSPIINKDIILVDDVVASGSTILRAIKLLKPYVNSISIVAIAKT